MRFADVHQADNVNPTSNPLTKNLEVSEDTLKEATSQINALRSEAHKCYLQTHFTLVEETSEEEWRNITKGVFF